ncbi:MAG TPA: amidase family protein [Acidimicrobiales bacterium]|jgi:amidase|nr:amidase family protein [Acidimicrobiales bacterium]
MPTDPSPATSEVAYLDAVTLVDQMASGRLESAEVVDTLLRRIADIDGADTPVALRSVLALADDAAEQAAASDRRRAAGQGGPLEGVPVLVKDNIEVVGLPSSAGATSLLGRPPAHDADLVGRLKDAGAVIIGSTNLSQWANIRSSRSSGGWSAVGGLTGNPWALDRNAGGSSSGSGAAVAAGLAPLAVGTETDGSITCPASVNGISGIKPTVGAVSTSGVVPVSSSQDSPGPLARTVADAALMLEVLAGRPGVVARVRRGVEGMRVAVADGWRTEHPGTDELFEQTIDVLAQAGAEMVHVTPAMPSPAEHQDEMVVLLWELKETMDRYLPTRGPDGPQNLVEVIAHEDAYAAVEQEWFGHEHFAKALEIAAAGVEAYREARARNLAWALTTCLEPALAGFDAMVAPTFGPAWKSDLVLGGHPGKYSPATMAPAVAGWPIATVPMGLTGGLPVGLGIIGRPGSEGDLLALGATVERPARPAWLDPRRG